MSDMEQEKTMNEETPEMEQNAAPETEQLAARLETAERERAEYLDMAQRLKAEFENFRRRNSAVRSEAWEDGARETIVLMLPVLDNLERALAAAPDKSPLRDGVELVVKQMQELLAKRGITAIDRLGEPFDPELENAVAQADPEEGEPGTVCTVLQKGYRNQNRVLRHALVRVVAPQ
ncbi:MAG: nucleotide exchange factor GrpE [Oscillospiraceae bacterium]|jgi:molecular chaperone GrpE|nr:nucleotide exchange factor GrpE [Oscillospiraceae bacterium]